MAETSKIEWTDATWNPVTGCSVVSPGCTNCYAMKLAGTRLQHHPSRAGLTIHSKAGPVWNGQVRLNEEWLTQPLRWKRPRMIFVCAHGDLFHESVPDEWIDRVFAVMALTPQHTFQVLTKRAARMREYLNELSRDRIERQGRFLRSVRLSAPLPAPLTMQKVNAILHEGSPEVGLIEHFKWNADRDRAQAWPLPNVWLGVSVEDQARADERVPDLLATPAAVRFVSAEPLLGPIDFGKWIPTCYECGASCGTRTSSIPDVERCEKCGEECDQKTEPQFSDGCPKCGGELEPVCPECGHYMVYQHPDTPNLDWIIVGGESGPGARPMHPDWARSIRDQCAAAGVPFFFKQWGEWGIGATREWPKSHVVGGDPVLARSTTIFGDPCYYAVPTEYTQTVRIMERFGKSRAGRLLDGVEHNGIPEARL